MLNYGGDCMLILDMLERMSLITIFTYVILQTNIIKHLVKEKYDKKDKIVMIILFSILSITGTYFGIYITDNSIANSRSIGTIVAGYLGGPAVGIIVGIVSGLHRYTLGGFTAFACSVSTIIEGIIGAGFRRIFKYKGLNPIVAALSAVSAEIAEIIIVFIFSSNLEAAILLEKKIAASMIFINSIGVFLIVMVVDRSKKLVDGQVKLVKLKEQNKIAELKALKAQIEPHFLFNSLNVIGAYCRTDADTARDLIYSLSDYFKGVLDIEGDFSTLQEELSLVKAYVSIEEARFLNRLKVEFFVDSTLLHVKFPILIIQPIVENAIKHGILKKIDGGIVKVIVCSKEDNVYVEICDDGIGFENASNSASTGLGLKNVRNRLKLLYGEMYDININSSNKGSKVSFFIPKNV